MKIGGLCELRRISGRIEIGGGTSGVDGAKSHLLCAAASRDDADSAFYEAHVELSVRLAAHRVERDFGSSAEAQIKRCDDDRTRAEFDRRGHSLKGTDSEIDLVPVPFLHRQQQ